MRLYRQVHNTGQHGGAERQCRHGDRRERLLPAQGSGRQQEIGCVTRQPKEPTDSKLNIPQGTLDLMIMTIVRREPIHGYGIAQRQKALTRGTFQINPGSLSPALYALERDGKLRVEGRDHGFAAPQPFVHDAGNGLRRVFLCSQAGPRRHTSDAARGPIREGASGAGTGRDGLRQGGRPRRSAFCKGAPGHAAPPSAVGRRTTAR